MFVAGEIRESFGLLTNSVLNVFSKAYAGSVMCYIFSQDYQQRYSKQGRRHQEVVPR